MSLSGNESAGGLVLDTLPLLPSCPRTAENPKDRYFYNCRLRGEPLWKTMIESRIPDIVLTFESQQPRYHPG
jgi:hypothetical protein